jgi:hypothetical protein
LFGSTVEIVLWLEKTESVCPGDGLDRSVRELTMDEFFCWPERVKPLKPSLPNCMQNDNAILRNSLPVLIQVVVHDKAGKNCIQPSVDPFSVA